MSSRGLKGLNDVWGRGEYSAARRADNSWAHRLVISASFTRLLHNLFPLLCRVQEGVVVAAELSLKLGAAAFTLAVHGVKKYNVSLGGSRSGALPHVTNL